MGKTRRSQHKKKKVDNKVDSSLSPRTQFAATLFVQVWEHLHKLHHEREKFALFWMWRNEPVFRLFVTQVLGVSIQKWSKGLLYNGYNRCRSLHFSVFEPHIWDIIDSVFANKSAMADLPAPVSDFIELFSSLSLQQLHELHKSQVMKVAKSTHFSREETTVELMDHTILDSAMDSFLGPWTEAILKRIDPESVHLCKHYPTSFVTLDSGKNYNAFYDKQGGGCKLILMILRQNVIYVQNATMTRTHFVDLFAAHEAIERNSCASLDSELKGFGPFWHSRIKGGGMKVSFYTHAKKLSQVLKGCTSIKQFSMIADQYAHEHITTILLALFMWLMPEALGSFFAYSAPFIRDSEYDPCDLERAIGGRGPIAYQMYITKDYCSEMHMDKDQAEDTLCYASHPDCGGQIDGEPDATPIQFTCADYGFRVLVRNKNLYMFRSDVTHGTGYQVPSRRPTYVGCLTVNSALSSLMKRRKLRDQRDQGNHV